MYRRITRATIEKLLGTLNYIYIYILSNLIFYVNKSLNKNT